MKDKSLDIWLIVIFGVSGLAVTMLAWLWPAMESERIMATLAGLVGIMIAVVKGLSLKKLTVIANDEQVAVKAEIEEKS